MTYRDWNIKTHATYLGHVAQYVSPTGQSYQTSDFFPSGEHAAAYARAMVDYLLECERFRLSRAQAPEAVCH